jgi:thymidine phosphorylase
MRRVVSAQGGNPAVLDDPALLPQAPVRLVCQAERSGVVQRMDVRAIGEAAVALGAGRITLDSIIDPAVGFHITVKPGDRVTAGQPFATVFARTVLSAEQAALALNAAITIGDALLEPPLPLISHRVTTNGVEEVAV